MIPMKGKFFCLFAAAFLFLFSSLMPPLHARAGCKASIRPILQESLPAFSDDLEYEGLDNALSKTISWLRKFPLGKKIKIGTDRFAAAALAAGYERFAAFIATRPDRHALAKYIGEYGRVYAPIIDKDPADVLFTGYFEPMLEGSHVRTNRFCYPVYARPDDLAVLNRPGIKGKRIIGRYAGKKLVAYYSRREITSKNVLDDRARVLAWVDDPVALFFLHVQGSGRIRFPGGASVFLHYDITNGLPYKSIGAYLVRKGKIPKDKISMQAIYDYLKAHPEEIDDVLDYNPRYVFFRIAPPGVFGSLGIPLTPGRSVALDSMAAPRGLLLFISSKKPVCNKDAEIVSWTPFSRFALNQDTGSAIRGLCRADIFWGSGEYARLAAGYMKEAGKLYFIVFDDALP